MEENKIENKAFAINAEIPENDVAWNGLNFKIKRYIPFDKMLAFVNDVTSACFTEDTHEYMPEIKDFLIRCYIVELYTDIKLPEDISEKYSVVFNTDLVSFIYRGIDVEQISSITEAIDKKIEYRIKCQSEATTAKINELIAEFSQIENSVSTMFDGMDKDTISKVAGAIANGNFDEEKLVKAFKAKI